MAQENSKLFESALSTSYYDKEFSISLYDREIENNPDKFIAWNNRGVCKVDVGIEKKDKQLALEGKEEIEKALEMAKKEGSTYPIAESNIKWATAEIALLD